MLCSLAIFGCALGGCAEPLVMSSYDSRIGVNWLIRPRRHRGVDFPAPTGTPVLASAPGTITKVYLKPTVGWIVRIRHEAENWDTRYLHLDSASVVPGDVVERGQSIGDIGLFKNSAGVEHVHIELYDLGMKHGESSIQDPMRFMVSCFDQKKAQSYKHSQLTYPIACQPSWSDETRPVESTWTGAGIQLEFSGLLKRSLGLRTRGIMAMQSTNLATGGIALFAGWNVGAGITSDTSIRYDGTILTGPGISHGLFDMGLLTGVGISAIPDEVTRGLSIPTMLFFRTKHRYLWMTIWARSQWVLRSPERQDGAYLSPLGIDEVAIGGQLRLPPLTKWGLELSLEYQQLVSESILSTGVGMSLDSF